MKIISSDVNPSNNPNLIKDLSEPEYLISLIQLWIKNKFPFNTEKWNHLSAEDYEATINQNLINIENSIWDALQKAEENIYHACNGVAYHVNLHDDYLIQDHLDYYENFYSLQRDFF